MPGLGGTGPGVRQGCRAWEVPGRGLGPGYQPEGWSGGAGPEGWLEGAGPGVEHLAARIQCG